MSKVPVWKFVNLCLAQAGDSYVFGAEVSPANPNPQAFDCSELIQWAMERCGVKPFPDGSSNQRGHYNRIPISEALRTRGAILGRDPSVTGVGHVAVSLGNGKTIEARGSDYGVGIFDGDPALRKWTDAGKFPELDYSQTKTPPKKIERWIVFGKFGGRFGHAQDFSGIVGNIKNAERKTGVALVVHRKEPVDLDEAKDWPSWKARKTRVRKAAVRRKTTRRRTNKG